MVNWLKIFKSKFKRKYLSKIAKEITVSTSKEEKIIATGNRCTSLSVWDFPIPTGVCSNPKSDEIDTVVQEDKLGQLLNNPIKQCIFCSKEKNYCFFGGNCDKKLPISEELVDIYRIKAKQDIEAKYGPRPENL